MNHSHLSVKRYVQSGYSPYYLGYTRVGLGDPYEHLFSIEYCSSNDTHSCLLIDRNEVDRYNYALDEPLRRNEQFDKGKILMSETKNLMSTFVSSLFHYQRQIDGEQ